MSLRSTRMGHGVGAACVALLISATVGGCAALPLPTPRVPPFGKNVILTPGTTTRDDVVNILGDPAARYCDAQEFLYARFQERLMVLFAVGVPSPMLPIGRVTSTQLGKDHVLRAQFDERGILRGYELEVTKGGWFGAQCTQSGVCIFQGSPCRYAAPEADAQAKRFEPVPGRCAVYIHWRSGAIVLDIDGKPAAPVVPKDGFVWLLLEPGSHTFSAAPVPGRAKGDDAFEDNVREPSQIGPLKYTVETKCEPESLLFVGEAHPEDEDESHWYVPKVLDAAATKPAIMERKLIMASDPWGEAACRGGE